MMHLGASQQPGAFEQCVRIGIPAHETPVQFGGILAIAARENGFPETCSRLAAENPARLEHRKCIRV
jgi:hypothetical protein